MRKLNKIIKKHTENKMSRNKKNIAVLEFLTKIIDYTEDNKEYEIIRHYFKKIRIYVFLEKYFEKEMIEKKIDIVFYLSNFLDKDMFEVEPEENFLEEILGFYEHLVHPDNSVRNKMMLMSVRIPTINKILKEYKG